MSPRGSSGSGISAIPAEPVAPAPPGPGAPFPAIAATWSKSSRPSASAAQRACACAFTWNSFRWAFTFSVERSVITGTAQKARIADLALQQIDDADTIFLDGGSTILELAKKLDAKHGLTVVTNSLMAAAELMESSHKLIIVGGEFRSLSRTLVGPLTSHIIGSLRIGKAFLGTIGFNVDEGISTTDANEAFTKELIMKRSEKVFVLADSSKFAVSSLALSGGLMDIDAVITDPDISPKALKALKANHIEVVF